MEKKCKMCGKSKGLGEFFMASESSNSHQTSNYCKKCHDDGKIPFGYGWYAGGHTSPNDKELGNIHISFLPL